MSNLYPLRPYQQQAIDNLKLSFRKGNNRPLLYAPTGAGKTVMAAHIANGALEKGKTVCFIVPFTVLINQTAKSFMDQGMDQPGIIQADHAWTDSTKRLQIASVQTLARRKTKVFDLYIIDEAHVVYSEIVNLAESTNAPFVALSGSPYTKGLGKIYNDLVIAKSLASLIDDGYLSDYIAYAPSAPDMKGAKTSMGDYQASDAGKRASEAKIIGSVTDTWLRLGENEATVCFACNVAHAQHLGIAFERIGVTNRVITAKTPHEEREEILELFSKGEVKILINVATLTTGLDVDVRCLIFARPTKSMILWAQCFGRALRTAPGKKRAIMLDHAGNFERLGRPEDHVIDCLDDGEKNESSKAKKDEEEKKEKLPKVCPKCKILKDAGIHECPACGFAPVFNQDVEVQDGELIQIKGPEKSKKATKDDKQKFWSELLGYRKILRARGKNYKDGWFSNKYREKFNVWPRGLSDISTDPTESTLGWIKSQQIAFSKSKEKR